MRFLKIILLFVFITPAKAADPLYFLGGINVGIFNDTRMVIEPFGLWMWGPIGTLGFGGQLFQFPATLYPDLTTIGLNGMDANPNGAGHMPPDGAYDIHAFGNPLTGDVGFITSLHGRTLDITPPVGYNYYRKLPYGVVVLGGMLYPNHVSNWPMPSIRFTNTEREVAAFPGATNAWVAVDFSKLISENARLGYFRVHVTGGTASVWISPTCGVPNTLFKTLMDNQSGISAQIGVRVDGNEHACFWTQGSGRVGIILDGFDITEVD